MPRQAPLVIGLLSHYFQDANLGCVALSISDVLLMDQVAGDLGIPIEYRVIVNEKHPSLQLSFTNSHHEYRVFPSAKQSVRHPVRLATTKVFDDCDLVVNINAGDGFTDLYGFGRVLTETYMSTLALLRHKSLVMAPQTIGPFDGRAARLIGARVLRRSSRVFTRDSLSTALCASLGVEGHTSEVIDVAFALPYEAVTHAGERPQVGVNVSGLLFRGGYDQSNYFGLAFDYREFIEHLIARLVTSGAAVHLIPHVLSAPGSIEDDYSACEQVHASFPETILAPAFPGPIEAKNYIAGLDFFTGARMHSTIAAFSSNVAVVPIGYSKKLNGLFDTLDYPYYIDARDPRWNTDDAVEQVLSWFEERAALKSSTQKSARISEDRLAAYRRELAEIFESTLAARS